MKLRHCVLSLLLAVALLLTMAVPAFAENTACMVAIGNQSTSFTIDFGNAEDRQVSGQQQFKNVPVGGTLKTSCDVVGILNVASSSQSGELQGWNVVGVADGPTPTTLASGLTTDDILTYAIPAGWNTVCFDPMFGSNGGGQGGSQDPSACEVAIGNQYTSFTLDFGNAKDLQVTGQHHFENVPVGGTLKTSCDVVGILNVTSSSQSEEFSGWDVIGVANGPANIAYGLTTEQVLNYKIPAGWNTVCFEPMFGNQGGNDGPQNPTIGDGEGVNVWFSNEGGKIEFALDTNLEDSSNEHFCGSADDMHFLGCLDNSTTLKANGLLDVKAVFPADQNRRFLGWNVTETSSGGVKDYADLLTTDELLKFVIPADMPAHPNYSLTIKAVWDKDISYYRSNIVYMCFGAYVTYPGFGDVYLGTVAGNYVGRGESIADTVFPAEPWRENDRFVGWRRAINILSFDKKGNYQGSSYDTSDKTIYSMDDIKTHTAPTEPYRNVYYVSVWQSDIDSGNDPLQYFGSGGASGVTPTHRTALFFAGDGNLEKIEKYDDGHTLTVNSGYFTWFNVRKGASIGQAFEGAGETIRSFGLNAHRNGYNFTGWNVYSIDERSIISVPIGTPVTDDEALGAIGPYRLDMGRDEKIPGNMIYQGYTKYTLKYEKLSHEAVFAIPVDGTWFAVPTWEESDKYSIEVPGFDDPAYETYLSIQEDVQLPIELAGSKMYGDIGKINKNLVSKLDKWAEKRGTKLDGSKIVEIKLLAKEKATGRWFALRQLPEEGIEILIPFPDKNNSSTGEHIGWQNGKYVVFHFIGSGERAGEIEELPCTVTPDGIKVTVNNLSPFAVGYIEDSVTVTPSEDGAGRQNPNTGVHIG